MRDLALFFFLIHFQVDLLAPMAHSLRLWKPCWVLIPAESDVCHVCIYTVLQTVQYLECAVLSMVLCSIKSRLQASLCRDIAIDCAESYVKQYSLTLGRRSNVCYGKIKPTLLDPYCWLSN